MPVVVVSYASKGGFSVLSLSLSQEHMPLLSIFSLALEQDSEQSCGLQQTTNNVYTHSFLQVQHLQHTLQQDDSVIIVLKRGNVWVTFQS